MKTQMPSTSATDAIEPITLTEGIIALNTTRGAARSDNPYSDFNICHYTDDTADHVEQCRQRLCDALGITIDRLIVPRQTHSTNVATLTSLPDEELADTDAIVTTMEEAVIGINTADCVPIVLADAEARVIAAVHAGWKGAARHIVAKTVEAMTKAGAQPKHITAAMGPCICCDCFEVGDEVVEQFRLNGHDIDRNSHRNTATGKYHIDLPGVCRDELIASGIAPSSIKMPHACTRCNPHRYFSARRLGIKSGRIFTAITLTIR